AAAVPPAEPITVHVPATKLGFLHSQTREAIEPAVQAYLQQTRWAGGPNDEIKSLHFSDFARLPESAAPTFVSILEADYVDGTSRSLCLATAVVSEERFGQLRQQQPSLMPIMRLAGNIEGLVIVAIYVPECAEQIVRLIAGKSTMTSRGAELA